MSSCSQEGVSSCPARRHVFLSNKKTRLLVQRETSLLVQQEDMSWCPTRRHVCLSNKKTCLLVQQEGMAKKTRLLIQHVQQEDMSSCPTRRHLSLFDNQTCLRTCSHDFLLNKKACLLAEREDISLCRTRRDVVSPCQTRNHM